MAATITGVVYRDLDNDGVFNHADTGISGVNVVLYSSGGCKIVMTDSNGRYTFSNVAVGSYIVYEVVGALDTCPPIQMTGVADADYPLFAGVVQVSVTVASTDTTVTGPNFGHQKSVAAPFSCSPSLLQFAGIPTHVYQINLVTGAWVDKGTLNPADYVNAVGYNTFDDYIYGYDVDANQIVRIDANGNLMFLGMPAGLPNPTNSYNVGCIDTNGYYYLYEGNTTKFYTINLNPNSVDYMRLVDPLNGYAVQTTSFGTTLNNKDAIADWVWLPPSTTTAIGTNGLLYGVTSAGIVTRVNLDNGHVVNLTTSLPDIGGSSVGAVTADADENIYMIVNQSGDVYRVNINGMNATGTYFSTSISTSNNDAAMCQNARVLLDFGDAPDTNIKTNSTGNYSTVLANNGPRHLITSNLTLGVTITAEDDALQNSDATGDVDDAFPTDFPSISPSAGVYSLTVPVYNATGGAVNLYGWIDWHADGIFAVNEGAMIVVPAGATSGVLVFNVPSGLTDTTTFARIRLTSDNLPFGISDAIGQDLASIGPAGDGEVEDYQISVISHADLSVVKTQLSPDPVYSGGQIQYSLTVKNNGPDIASAPVVSDVLSSSVRNATYTLDGAAGGAWINTLTLPDMAVGDSHEIIIIATITMDNVTSVENVATVNSNTQDPDKTNNTSQTITTSISPAANVQVVKSATLYPAIAGLSGSYVILVSNAGPNDATNVLVEDVLSDSIIAGSYTVVTNSGTDSGTLWTGSYTIPTLTVGESTTITINCTVKSSATDQLENLVTAHAAEKDPDETNNTYHLTTPVITQASLTLTKAASDDVIQEGNDIVYTVSLRNDGPSDATEIQINDVVPNPLTSAWYSLDDITYAPWTGSYQLATLGASDTFTLYIKATVPIGSSGVVNNVVTATSQTTGDTVYSANAVVSIGTSADLWVQKSGSVDHDAKTVAYTIQIGNDGPHSSTAVVLIEDLPAEVENIMYTTNPTDPSSWQSWNYVDNKIDLGEIQPSIDVFLYLKGDIAPTFNGNFTNKVTVSSSDTPDPNVNNNTSTVVLSVDVPTDISLAKSVVDTVDLTTSLSSITAGSLITYKFEIDNIDLQNNAADVMLTDTFPTIVENPMLSIDGGATFDILWTGSYQVSDLMKPGDKIVLYMRGRIPSSLNTNLTPSLTNTAQVATSSAEVNLANNVSTTTVTLVEMADLQITKTSTQTGVIAGDKIEATLTVYNAGPSDANSVTVVDAVPAMIQNPMYRLTTGETDPCLPWPGSYLINNLPALATQNIYVQGTVIPEATGNVVNAAQVLSLTPDPDPTNNQSILITPVTLNANLGIVKSSDQPTAIAGSSLSYDLAITNNGPSYAKNVVLTDTIPLEVMSPQYSLDGGLTWNTWQGEVNIDSMTPGSTYIIKVRGMLGADAIGIISNTATVTSDTPDDDPDDNSSTLAVQVEDVCDITVTISTTTLLAKPGDWIDYTILASNLGPSDASAVTFNNQLPVGMAVGSMSYSFNNSDWQPLDNTTDVPIGDLGIADYDDLPNNITFYLKGQIDKYAVGSVTNEIGVATPTTESNYLNNADLVTVPIVQSADLAINKTANPMIVENNGTVTYTLTILNGGPSAVTDFIVVDLLPSELEHATWTLDGTPMGQWEGIYSYTAPDGTSFEMGAQAVIQITTEVTGTVMHGFTNTAFVDSSTIDPFPTNNTSSIAVFLHVPSSDLSIDKELISPSPLIPGNDVSYLITVTNNGPDDAINTVITDIVPSFLQNPSYQVKDLMSDWQPWLGAYTTDLASGSSIDIYLKGTLNLLATGDLTNIASVRSDSNDPNLGDNNSTNTEPIAVYTDITVDKTTDATLVEAGDTIVYAITISNVGANSAQDVVYTDADPFGLGAVQYCLNNCDDDVNWLDWTGSFALGTIDTGDSATFKIRGVVQPEANNGIDTTAVVATSTPETNYDNNTASIFTPLRDLADLVLTKTAAPDEVEKGDTMTYNFTLVNNGPSHADDYVITDILPTSLSDAQYWVDGVAMGAWTGSYSYSHADSEEIFDKGATINLVIKAVVNDTLASGIIQNVAFVQSTTADPDLSNNTGVTTTKFIGTDPEPCPPCPECPDCPPCPPIQDTADVGVVATNCRASQTTTIIVSNTGPKTAKNVKVKLPHQSYQHITYNLPKKSHYFRSWSHDLCIGDIKPNDDVQILIRDCRPSYCECLTVTVSSDTKDANLGNNTLVIHRNS